ncbi:MAG: hypothetical protein QXQ40_01800 [Candidatus Aenigmatarchaeota archaeon]
MRKNIQTQAMITVYTGPMFSGKSTALVNELKIGQIPISITGEMIAAGFKPIIDTRYSGFTYDESLGLYIGRIDLHNGNYTKCYGLKNFEEICDAIKILDDRYGKIRRIGIDEANFFSDNPRDIQEILEYLAYHENREIIVAGLDLNYRGEPFHPVPEILSIADKVIKKTAVCVKCGNMHATRSQRLDLVDIKNGKPIYNPSPYDAETIIVGGAAINSKEFQEHVYEPRCIACHEVPGKPKRRK